ncbi:MAG: hypothetical protein JNK15_02090 [Planctomycetes bacterium]|nr:hypothetical protein [Planctomycetota bacterium]
MRRSRVAVAASLLAACAPAPTPAARAVAWLAAQQGARGLWCSDTYGVLRRGESTTAAIAFVLATSPEPERTQARPLVERALAALAARRAPSPVVPPEPVDYPVFTAAHQLHTLAVLRPDGWRPTADELVAFLRRHQLGPANGWPPDAPESGGFGLGAKEPQHPRGGDLVGLATQAAVLRALAAADVPPDDPMVASARAFVQRCQCDDGGFRYAPVDDWRGTKAGDTREANGRDVPRSHGSATCDGILALLAAGDRADTPAVARALDWLGRRAAAQVPGLEHAADPTLEPSLRLYWAASLAAVARALPDDARAAGWRSLAGAIATGRQQPDGSFRGLAASMKEDDPLVATLLGLSALPHDSKQP